MFELNERTPKVVGSPLFYAVFGVVLLGADALTGPFLQFPILFVLPVFLAGWYSTKSVALALAIGLPVGRFLIRDLVEPHYPLPFALLNYAIRIAVLLLVACLVVRTSRQTAELKQRVEGLVKICAWGRTVEFEGEWLSFEEYLKRRFGLNATHGISPIEQEKILAGLRSRYPSSSEGG